MTQEKLHSRDFQEDKLYELIMGYTCNLRCLFCSTPPERNVLNKSSEELFRDIYRARKEGYKILGLGGGEPTLRKDLPRFVRFAKKAGFEVVRMETNGFLLSNFELCKRLVDAGMDFFKISVHGHKAQIHDFLTQREGSFQRIMKAIENLHKLEMRIEASIVLTKTNYKFVPQYVDFFSRQGIHSFCIIFPEYAGYMRLNYREIGITMTEVAPYVQEAMEIIRSLGLDKGLVFNIPRCFLGSYADSVVEKYNMKLMTPHIVVEDADLDIREGKQKFVRCKKCPYESQCSGVWKNYIEIYGDREFSE